MSFRLLRILAATAFLAAGSAQAAVNLPAYNIDTSSISVSGLSSGGFMANQLGIAYSATFRGVGIFAAGPYMCAGHSNYTACMYNATISSAMLSTMQTDINNWSTSGAIDNKSNIATQKIYMFVGSSDSTVGPNPMNGMQTQYTNNGVPAANLTYVQRASTGHTFPTDFDSTGNNTCSTTASPYISNCGYDGAKEAFTKFYGTLAARNNAPAAANYIEFNQTEFSTNVGMASTGWVYVPASCAAGGQCKLHVALHGCQQSTDKISTQFVKNTGYTRWADTNNIIVLFPQTKVDNASHSTSASGSLANPNACWDWIGWYGTNFAQKNGTQMAAIKAMVDRVKSGAGSGGGGGGGTGTLPAPTAVATSNATMTTMKITWGAVTGASSYNVFRNGNKVNATGVTTTNYTDTGLAAATSYTWTVAGVDSASVQGAVSTGATGTTTGTATPPATCYTATNYAHTTAGRAHQSGGYALANGSNQNMGLWNTFVTTTLKMTAANYYVIGTCP